MMFPALVEPSVRRYLSGQVISVIGAWTQTVTMNLLLWQLTESPAMLGALNFLIYGPVLVLGPFAGGRIGPRNARGAVLVALFGSILTGLGLLTLWLTDHLSPSALLAAAGIMGTLSAAEIPGRQVLLTSSLRERSLLAGAVALNTMAYNIGRMIGPACAALLFRHAGPGVGLGVSAIALSVMIWCVRGIRPDPALVQVRAGGLRAAFAFARANPFARRQLPVLVCLALFAGSYQTLIPVLADHEFHDVSAYTGVFFLCAGAGSLSSAMLLSSQWAGRLGGPLLIWAPAACALALLTIAASPYLGLVGASFTVLGLGITFTATSINTGLQGRAPDALRGGMIGLYGTAFVGMMPIGHLIAGQLSDVLGVRPTLAVHGALLLIGIGTLAALDRRPRAAASDDAPPPSP